jgi:hypothetical protein
MDFGDRCEPVRIANRDGNSVLQALQSQKMNIRRILPGGTGPRKKKLRGFSPQANYTDRAIAAGQRS